ncbi:Os10g0100900 [Oryza sativa Japonica Group]|uniref:Os10g0100900 protein n=2 Tax=Oryza sativa subsp. japonica TaxID=39947 RepID=Q0IZD9_ORYSJ|nr:Os10g0100900 [Oryza sativa Japonica Group]BAT09559.1 Os10g0100900 [Oryza sativa Japonica Group]|eukprot:NP_001064012.1 Os10g0100900 [Oryza sativa Japonica Group]
MLVVVVVPLLMLGMACDAISVSVGSPKLDQAPWSRLPESFRDKGALVELKLRDQRVVLLPLSLHDSFPAASMESTELASPSTAEWSSLWAYHMTTGLDSLALALTQTANQNLAGEEGEGRNPAAKSPLLETRVRLLSAGLQLVSLAEKVRICWAWAWAAARAGRRRRRRTAAAMVVLAGLGKGIGFLAFGFGIEPTTLLTSSLVNNTVANLPIM